MKLKIGKKFAFTLAEVLITLGVIGIVAALTLPNLIKTYQKNETVEKLKESYSIINQILNRAAADNGCKLADLFNYDGSNFTNAGREALTTNFVQSYIVPYAKVNRVCGFNRSGECAYSPVGLNNANSGTNGWDYLILLSNGMSFSFVPDNNGSAWMGMYIMIDLNGRKKPNKAGVDFFYLSFYSSSSKITFRGAGSSRSSLLTNCNKLAYGDRCAALIVLDNWKIADDYPWN